MANLLEASTTGLPRRDLLKTGLLLAGEALLPTAYAAPAATPPAAAQDRVTTQRKLGTLDVCNLGLGVQNTGRTYQTTVPTRREMLRIIHTAYGQGVTLLDAAEAYGPFEAGAMARK